MTIYFINMIVCVIICSLVDNGDRNLLENRRIDNQSAKVNMAWMCIFIIWVLMYGLRFHVGTDSWSFYASFQRYLVEGQQTFSEFVLARRDTLFSALEYACYKVFNGSWIGLQIVLGFITYLPIVLVIKRESVSYAYTVLLYIFTLSFYTGYNITRQAIAVGITMFSYYYFFREKKYKSYAMGILIALGFHSATMFAFPFHFLANREYSRKRALILSTIMGGVLVVLDPLWHKAISLLSFLGQDKMASDYATLSDNNMNIFRLLVFLVPAIFVFIFYDVLKEEFPDIDHECNLVTFAAIINLCGSRNVIFARVADFIMITQILLMPKFKFAFHKKTRWVANGIILLLYFIYMFLILRSGDGHYIPYDTVFNFDVR